MEAEFKAYLDDVYFRQRRMQGRDALYNFVKRDRPDLVEAGLSRRKIMQYLRGNEVHQLFWPVRNLPRTQATVPKEPFAIVALDLIDLRSMAHAGYNYALTGYDLFSKKTYATALRDKSAESVVKGLALMLFGNRVQLRVHKHGSQDMQKWELVKAQCTSRNPRKVIRPQFRRHPRHFRCDNGPELKNALMDQFLERFTQPIRNAETPSSAERPTTIHFSEPHAPWSNGAIESRNRVIKRHIKMAMTQFDEQDWPTMLKTICHNLNTSVSRVTKYTPNEVEDAFLQPTADVTPGPTTPQVQQNIIQSITARNRKHRLPNCSSQFHVGQVVRVRLNWIKTNGLNWSRQLYTIQQVIGNYLSPNPLHRKVRYKLAEVSCDSKAQSPTAKNKTPRKTQTRAQSRSRSKKRSRARGRSQSKTRDEPQLVPGLFTCDQLQLHAEIQHPVSGPQRFVVRKLIRPVLRHRQAENDEEKGDGVRMFEVSWVGYRQTTEEPRATLILDVPHLVRQAERDWQVRWHRQRQPSFRKPNG